MCEDGKCTGTTVVAGEAEVGAVFDVYFEAASNLLKMYSLAAMPLPLEVLDGVPGFGDVMRDAAFTWAHAKLVRELKELIVRDPRGKFDLVDEGTDHQRFDVQGDPRVIMLSAFYVAINAGMAYLWETEKDEEKRKREHTEIQLRTKAAFHKLKEGKGGADMYETSLPAFTPEMGEEEGRAKAKEAVDKMLNHILNYKPEAVAS